MNPGRSGVAILHVSVSPVEIPTAPLAIGWEGEGQGKSKRGWCSTVDGRSRGRRPLHARPVSACSNHRLNRLPSPPCRPILIRPPPLLVRRHLGHPSRPGSLVLLRCRQNLPPLILSLFLASTDDVVSVSCTASMSCIASGLVDPHRRGVRHGVTGSRWSLAFASNTGESLARWGEGNEKTR
jgi:hypothetical protein